MKQVSILLILAILLLSLTACGTDVVKGTILRTSENGHAVLDIMPQKIFKIVEIGEIAVLTIGHFRAELHLVDNLIAEDGKLQLYYDAVEHTVSIVSYNQDFCAVYQIPENAKVSIGKT